MTQRRTRPLREPRTWTLRQRIGRMFLILAAALTVLVPALVISTVQFVRSGNSVVYTWQPAAVAANRLSASINGQEAALRGYALAHDESFPALYRDEVARQQREQARLGSQLGGDSALRRRLADLDDRVREWHATIAEPALTGIAAHDPAAARLAAGPRSRQLSAAIRANATEFVTAVQDRADQMRRERRTYLIVFVVAISLTALVFVVAAGFIWRGLRRWVLEPVDLLGRQTREVARGDTYRQIVPAGPAEFAGLGSDVEAMRLQIAGQLAKAEEIQEELRVRTEELVRSNEDLQQFAYVASHDLSEPLRKVANFCQLLERQYADQLDERARQYIDFAVDGAKRMQLLIADLLALSRVGRTTDEFVPVDLDTALDTALATLADRIAEANARIERPTPLPTVVGDRVLLTSLLENLIGNAVKYRREGVVPIIKIWAEHDRDERLWTLTVADNGIGIEAKYAERIFTVFQRLHLRDRYDGTGVGLAICRKIVEFHGGHIWLDPVESIQGATFRLTLPEGGVLAESRD